MSKIVKYDDVEKNICLANQNTKKPDFLKLKDPLSPSNARAEVAVFFDDLIGYGFDRFVVFDAMIKAATSRAIANDEIDKFLKLLHDHVSYYEPDLCKEIYD